MALSMKEIRDKVDGNEMDLSLMSITKVPVKEIASIPKATRLDLSCNQIVKLPDTFCSVLTYLVKLDLSKNRLTELPADIYKLANLQHLDLYQNELETLPVTISRLKALKWLDLKDNPLQVALPKVVGGCLDDEQCKKCALSVVAHFRVVASELERQKQEHLAKEREKQAVLKQKEEEEERKRSEARKKQKKLEKEARRKRWEQMQREKELENKKRKRSDESTDSDSDAPDEKSSRPPQQSWFLSFWGVMVTALVALLACVIGVYFYCQENQKNEECVLVCDWVQNYKQVTKEHVRASLEVTKDLLHKGGNKLSEMLGKLGF